MTDLVVSRETLKRIISDISQITKNPLEDHGIYYKHDDSNMLKGYVMIVPTDDTPYQYGNYFYTIEFPINYPYSPPKMQYLTNNGTTRFHPNFYRNGKVCLSILNTWKGEQWTSCNTLSSVLLNVVTLFTKKPFLHEPGITESHESFLDYTECIKYQNFNVAIFSVLADKELQEKINPVYQYFKDQINKCFSVNAESIIKKVKRNALQNPYGVKLNVPFYKMYEFLDYPELYRKLKEYNDSL